MLIALVKLDENNCEMPQHVKWGERKFLTTIRANANVGVKRTVQNRFNICQSNFLGSIDNDSELDNKKYV